MQNEKYFSIQIEDIRIGYECEVYRTGWKSFVFTKDTIAREFIGSGDCFRVPYLTKEKIEAEGWKSIDLSKEFAYRAGIVSYRHAFVKGNYFLVLDTRKYHIEIIAADVTKIDFLPEFPETFRVTIPCKDINTFRFICRLLSIA